MKRFPVLVLSVGVCAVLSGCTGSPATTTPPPSATHAPPSPAATVTTPAATTPPLAAATSPAAAAVQSCVALLTPNTGNLLAATYLADTCTMGGTTIQLTGPATTPEGRFITYGNGLTVALAEVQRMPNNYGSDLNGTGTLRSSYALVRVDLTVTNTGTTPFNLAAMTNQFGTFSVMYADGQTAQSNSGTIDATSPEFRPLIIQDNPPLVVPVGGRVDLYNSFDVPLADLGSMSVGVEPNPNAGYTPYRITGINVVMVPFH